MLGFSAIGVVPLAAIPISQQQVVPNPPVPQTPSSGGQPHGRGHFWEPPKERGKPVRKFSRREMRDLLEFLSHTSMSKQEKRAYIAMRLEFMRATDDEDVAYLLTHDTLH